MTQAEQLQGMDRARLLAAVDQLGLESYRAEQMMRWVHQRGADSLDAMTNLPKSLRAELKEKFLIDRLDVLEKEVSQDGTVKLLLGVDGGHSVEAVLIPEKGRRTACVSSQAGCGIGCPFCATAIGGLGRNLRAFEIVDQIAALTRATNQRVTHVVFMGMGEPFANYQEVVKAARILNDPWAYGIGARHITVSTSGVVPSIQRFAEEERQFLLAISLHAGTDDVRDRLVPLNKKYPLAELMRACREYTARTSRRVTFEYVMIDGVNDGLDQAEGMIRHIEGMLCHVNLIPLNAVAGTGFRRSNDDAVERFKNRLLRAGIQTTVRKERGADINAACGQLRRSRAG